MSKISHLKPFHTILVCCILSITPFLSLLFHIPEYVDFIGIILIALIVIYNFKSWNKKWKIATSVIAISSITWLLWGSVCWPLWNSEFLSSNLTKSFEYTNSPDHRICKKDAIIDLEFAYKNICKNHPALIDSIPKSLDDAFHFAHKQIEAQDSISVISLYAIIQTMTATLHDGHTMVFPRFQTFHQINLGQYGKLLSVNNISLDDIFEHNKHLYSSETDDFSHFLMNNNLSIYEYLPLFNFDINNGIIYSFINNGDTIDKKFFKEDFFTNEYEQPNIKSQTNISNFSIVDSLDYGYFDIHHFECFLPGKMRLVKNDISTFFDSVSQHNINNVIFDVRYNTGGNPRIWYYIINHLSDKKRIYYGKGWLRCGPFKIKYRLGFNNAKNAKQPYKGNVYLLTSTLSFSASMEFANCLQENNLGKIVGLSPGNTPNCYTSIFVYCLPKSKLRIQVSNHEHIVNRPGIVNNRIVPDYECPSEEALKQVLNIIKEHNPSKE